MTAPLKVLHVEAGMHLYGGALQVLYLLRGLPQEQVRNILVCPRGSAIASACDGVIERVIEMPMGGDLDLAFIARLRAVIREQRPDLVHLHSRRGADTLGGIAARLAGVPCIVSRRVDNPEPAWLARIKYRLYERVVTISEGIRQVLLSEGVPADKVVCVHSAVDREKYHRDCEREWFLREFGLSTEAYVLGVIAQLIPRKGHRYLLQALPPLVEEYPDLCVLFLGKGPLEQELKQQITALQLDDVVQLTGFRADLERILPCLYTVVHPAEMEGLGVSLLQAAAAGVPIIGTRAGGIPEIVRQGENGLLISPQDVAALQDAVGQLLADPERARQMGQAGTQIVAQEFSIAAMVQGNLRVYRKVVGAPHAPPQ